MNRSRTLVAALSLSLAALATWQGSEGFTDHAIIPVTDDVPTIGYGSTRWESGAPVKLGDTISRERAAILARNLMRVDEQRLADSLPGVSLYQEEYDVYVDFIGQYGIGNWRKSSMRRHLLAGNYRQACDALLLWRRGPGGFDCSTPGNKRCAGVWTRQLERHAQCWSVQ